MNFANLFFVSDVYLMFSRNNVCSSVVVYSISDESLAPGEREYLFLQYKLKKIMLKCKL